LKNSLQQIFTNSLSIFWGLCKILIPIIVALKILEPFGIIEHIASLLEGTMQLVGLPGYTAIVWASALLGNLYTGLIVLITLWDQEPLNIAQVSTLCLMMLVAHSMLVEVIVAHKSGANAIFSTIWRFANAYFMGWLCFVILDYFSLFTETATLYLQPTPLSQTLTEWLIEQIYLFTKIYLIILTLSTMMHLIKKIGIEKYLHIGLTPLLKIFNLSEKTANTTLIGMFLGISYGAAFLISDVKNKRISKKEGCVVLTILNLNHALIEDSLLMLLVGSTLWIVLLFRLTIGLFLCFIFTQLLQRFPIMERWVVS
jgi:hypothetical protein